MALDPARYPPDWKLRSRFVRFYRAKGACEWCGAEHMKSHPLTGSRVVLTTAHVFDKDPMAASLLNLAALCQRCHLRHDARQHAETKKKNRRKNQGDLFVQTCREYVKQRVLESDEPQDKLARRMKLSPSALTRKLNQYDDDTMRFTLDDLERYIQCTGDNRPVLYLVEKYLTDTSSKIADLERQLEEYKRLAELKGRAE